MIETHLEVDTNSLIFDRVPRMGSNTALKPRPIVGRFHYYSDYFSNREKVREKFFDENIKRKLIDTGLGIGIQRIQQIRDAIKALYPIMETEESKGNSVRLVSNYIIEMS